MCIKNEEDARGCNSSDADVEGFTAGYRSMCQFLSLPLLQLPEVLKYDVIMRLDSDSFIHGATASRGSSVRPIAHSTADEVRLDPFQEFSNRQCSYGYIAVGSEHPRMLRGLFETIQNFMSRASEQAQPVPLQPWFRRAFLDEHGAYNGNFFYNNFEM